MSGNELSIDEFSRVEMRVGLVVEAVSVAGSEKLIRCLVAMGEEKPRVVFAGVRQWYEPEELVGRQVVVVVNLAPKKMMGEMSQGMILAGEDETGKPVLLAPWNKAKLGSRVR